MFLFPLSFSGLKDEATFVAGGDGREEEEACVTVVSSHGPRNRSAALSPRHNPAFQYGNHHWTKLGACSFILSLNAVLKGKTYFRFKFGEFCTESLVCRLLLQEEEPLSPLLHVLLFSAPEDAADASPLSFPFSARTCPSFCSPPSSSWIHEKLAPSSPPSLFGCLFPFVTPPPLPLASHQLSRSGDQAEERRSQ